ncbi:MAG TPA: DAK2 domain-containing protein [Mycobacteriales bacterium]|jgi:hypothetical protein|nr:DAK2 domain-containing protein [Mycobacteriales bacterium]
MALDRLDAAAVRRWLGAARRDLEAHRAEIDELNVYPVPDGDTGTNLALTMESVAAALAEAGDDLAAVCAAAARGALLGARGNSGVILSQLLRGAGEVLGATAGADGADLRKALRRAAETAYGAVATPVEGTILSVARAAADAAEAEPSGTLADVVTAAARGAGEALRRTPSQLAALARAGVVDAGGRGLCVVLDALVRVVGGAVAEEAPEPLVPRSRSALAVAREAGSDEYAYEVQYLLDAADVTALRERLGALGDSLVVVGGDGLWNVHVHVNDVGAAIEAGVEAGRPHRITVTRFADQTGQATPSAAGGRAVVAVVQGDGLAELYEAAGAVVVTGGPSACPSTGMLLDAVLATGAAEVVLLPNDGNVAAAALHAAAEARAQGRDVHVVPTRSPVQGLAALAVADAAKGFADDAIAMSAAASGTRWAEVTTAVRDAQTSAGACRAGDVLGLVDGDVAVIGADLAEVAYDVLSRLLGAGGELVTIVTGEGCPAGLGDALAERVAAAHPLVEAEVHTGGQPHYPLLLGVE